MSDRHELLERIRRQVPAPGFGELLERRDRKAQRARKTAGVTGLVLTALVIGGVVVALGGLRHESSPGSGDTVRPGGAIERHGIGVLLPGRWEDRITYVEGMPGPVWEAATLPLPSLGDQFRFAASEDLGPDDAAMGLYEFTSVCPCPGFSAADGPLSLGSEDARPDLPEDHTFLERRFEANGRVFVLWAEIGSRPAPDAVLQEIDDVARSLTFGTSAGVPSPMPVGAAVPPTFEEAPGWRTASDPLNGSDLVAWAANVPFPASQVQVFAEYDALGVVPTEMLDTLPGDGIVMVASLLDGQIDQPDEDFPLRSLPLRLSDATVNRSWEFQPPGTDVPWYLITAAVNGHLLRVDVYFGTGDPGPEALDAAQAQLDRLVVPRLDLMDG